MATAKVKYLAMFEEYFDYQDDLTPDQWYQFTKMISNLRFKGIDTPVNSIDDKELRLVWRSVRPAIYKSYLNSKDFDKREAKVKQPVEDAPVEEDFNEEQTEEIEPEKAPEKVYKFPSPVQKEIDKLNSNPDHRQMYEDAIRTGNAQILSMIEERYCNNNRDKEILRREIRKEIA